MKLVVHWLLVACVLALAPAGCSVSHRSGDFACTTQADCATGRICTGGLCVTTLDSGLPPDGQPAGCPAQCTSCNATQKTCAIDCAVNAAACNQPITCPVGWACNILCTTPDSCSRGVNCAVGTACTVACSGSGSCPNLTSGSGRYNISCTGQTSCSNLSCGAACACDVTCSLNSRACRNLTCKSTACTAATLPGGCTSAPLTCNTCP